MMHRIITTESTEFSQSLTEKFSVSSVRFSPCPPWLIFSFHGFLSSVHSYATDA